MWLFLGFIWRTTKVVCLYIKQKHEVFDCKCFKHQIKWKGIYWHGCCCNFRNHRRAVRTVASRRCLGIRRNTRNICWWEKKLWFLEYYYNVIGMSRGELGCGFCVDCVIIFNVSWLNVVCDGILNEIECGLIVKSWFEFDLWYNLKISK